MIFLCKYSFTKFKVWSLYHEIYYHKDFNVSKQKHPDIGCCIFMYPLIFRDMMLQNDNKKDKLIILLIPLGRFARATENAIDNAWLKSLCNKNQTTFLFNIFLKTAILFPIKFSEHRDILKDYTQLIHKGPPYFHSTDHHVHCRNFLFSLHPKTLTSWSAIPSEMSLSITPLYVSNSTVHQSLWALFLSVQSRQSFYV